jgi:hypothetical protein
MSGDCKTSDPKFTLGDSVDVTIRGATVLGVASPIDGVGEFQYLLRSPSGHHRWTVESDLTEASDARSGS